MDDAFALAGRIADNDQAAVRSAKRTAFSPFSHLTQKDASLSIARS